MKHLYIIGNGFDIFTGIKSSYADFKRWLQRKYPFIYENLCDTYKMEGEWWNDFEINIGKLDIFSFVDKFIQKNYKDELSTKDEGNNKAEELNIPPSFLTENPCADRLAGLLDVLQYCFEKWVYDILDTIDVPNRIYLEKQDSYYINFNYTDTLQLLYNIQEDRIFHIHGRATNRERLVFGHNQYHKSVKYDSPFIKPICEELDKYYKEPCDNYCKRPWNINKAEHIHVYGLSFSTVDEGYIDWILHSTPQTSTWEISWYSEKDMERISAYIAKQPSLLNRVNLVRLEALDKS